MDARTRTLGISNELFRQLAQMRRTQRLGPVQSLSAEIQTLITDALAEAYLLGLGDLEHGPTIPAPPEAELKNAGRYSIQDPEGKRGK